MKAAIRYYSKFGHSKKMAEVVSELTTTEAHDVSTPLSERVDTLYLGAGVFMGKVNKKVIEFINGLDASKVGKVVCFGSCAIIKSPVPQLRSALESQGISVSEKEFTCKGSMGPLHSGHPNKEDLDQFREFIKSTL